MVTTYVDITAPNLPEHLKIALASDLHNCDPEPALSVMGEEKPNLILIPGDLTDDVTAREKPELPLRFLSTCAKISPTFYSLGNHEIACYHKRNPFRKPHPVPICEEYRSAVKKTGAILLENDAFCWNGVQICGLTSGINGKENHPDFDTLQRFSKLGEPKILLCHHPEYYVPYLKKEKFDLVVSGHAHGGHWRFFGRGVYTPGQGLFPKWTSGVIDGVCVISRGLGDHTKIPRLFNPRELIVIRVNF